MRAPIDAEPGRGVYTQWLNDRGGIEADLTVTRLNQDEFWVITSAASQTRDWAWLRRASRQRRRDFRYHRAVECPGRHGSVISPSA